MFNEELFDEWIKALESGKYKQGFCRLKDGTAYCCLGVAAKIAINNKLINSIKWGLCNIYDDNIANLFGLNCKIENKKLSLKLMKMNDIEGYTFTEITAYLKSIKSELTNQVIINEIK